VQLEENPPVMMIHSVEGFRLPWVSSANWDGGAIRRRTANFEYVFPGLSVANTNTREQRLPI